MGLRIMKKKPKQSKQFKPKCDHARHTPAVPDDDTLCEMSNREVRRKYPRYDGICEDCGAQVIVYASFMHYIAGDW